MVKQKFLWALIAFSLISQQPLICYASDDSKDRVIKSSATRNKINKKEQEISDEEIENDILSPINHDFKPGFFYRTSNYKDMAGVYTKKALYYDIDLFEDKQNIYSFVTTHDTVEQLLGVVFFGIWSYPHHTNKREETIEIVEVPVREVKEKRMFYKNGEDTKLYPRLIWETGHGTQRVIKEESRRYKIIPCKGKHTEKRFKTFIKDKKNQEALWEYFIEESKGINHTKRKLDLVSFKFYSWYDACDTCFEKLFSLQSNHKDVLTHLPPQEILELRQVPFQIVFSAHSFYNPHNTGGEYGASLYFYPIKITPLIRLHGYNKNESSHECRAISNGEETNDVIKHQEEVKFKELQQLNFIILKIKNGEEKKVKLTPPSIW